MSDWKIVAQTNETGTPDACTGGWTTLAKLQERLKALLPNPIENSACIAFLRKLIADLTPAEASYEASVVGRRKTLKDSLDKAKKDLECILSPEEAEDVRKKRTKYLDIEAEAKTPRDTVSGKLKDAIGLRDQARADVAKAKRIQAEWLSITKAQSDFLTALEARLALTNDANKKIAYFHLLEAKEAWDALPEAKETAAFTAEAIVQATAVRLAEEKLAGAEKPIAPLEALERELVKEADVVIKNREKSTLAELKGN